MKVVPDTYISRYSSHLSGLDTRATQVFCARDSARYTTSVRSRLHTKCIGRRSSQLSPCGARHASLRMPDGAKDAQHAITLIWIAESLVGARVGIAAELDGVPFAATLLSEGL